MNEKVSAVIEKVKEFYEKVVSFVAEQWETNRTLLLAFCALIICIPLILIVVIGAGSSKTEEPKSEIEIEDYIYLPAEPSMGNDYILSREQQSQWSEEEARRWFVEPDGKMMNDIRTVNDKLINDLLEAVP